MIILCIPKIADCGGLIIGADKKLPKTPPLDIVKLPPVISSKVNCPLLALSAKSYIALSISGRDISYTFLITGTTKPLGEETATEMSI